MSRLERGMPEQGKSEKIILVGSILSHLSDGKEGITPLIHVPSRKKELSHLNPTDIIPPENFERLQLDRKFFHINQIFLGALGLEKTPLQASVERVRREGNIKLLDVGCGTGNTLRTWRDVIASRAPCDISNIEMTGISLNDYSQESASADTLQAHAEGNIRYLVGDATNRIDMPDNSVDVAIAHASLIHMPNAVDSVKEMVRVTNEKGVLYLDFSARQNFSDSPEMELLFDLEEQGSTVDIKPVLIDEKGLQQIRVFCRVEKQTKS